MKRQVTLTLKNGESQVFHDVLSIERNEKIDIFLENGSQHSFDYADVSKVSIKELNEIKESING